MTAAARTPRPRETPERCAPRAELRGDPMLGSAFTSARVLLVEQPGPWGARGLPESHFGSAAGELEARAAGAGVRVQVIRRHGRTPEGAPRHWALADTRLGRASLRWGTFTDPDELLELPLDVAAGALDLEPLYLVCAHSKRDACCALRGRPLAAELDALRPGRVWETSHLGGHRFAANVLVLPSGLLYGRVLPLAAAEFVAAAEADEVVAGLLRGRVGHPPAEQAALGYAHEHLAVRRRDGLRVESTWADGPERSVVRLRGPHGLVDVTVVAETVTGALLSCRDSRPEDYVSYRAVSATPGRLDRTGRFR